MNNVRLVYNVDKWLKDAVFTILLTLDVYDIVGKILYNWNYEQLSNRINKKLKYIF